MALSKTTLDTFYYSCLDTTKHNVPPLLMKLFIEKIKHELFNYTHIATHYSVKECLVSSILVQGFLYRVCVNKVVFMGVFFDKKN